MKEGILDCARSAGASPLASGHRCVRHGHLDTDVARVDCASRNCSIHWIRAASASLKKYLLDADVTIGVSDHGSQSHQRSQEANSKSFDERCC